MSVDEGMSVKNEGGLCVSSSVLRTSKAQRKIELTPSCYTGNT